MSKVPSLGYERVISALRRDGWVVLRKKAATFGFKSRH